ncbi:MAG: HAD hydrolase-like protein [FCB group bacterium]|nr:HAD hydrolase-like protein [FCB group bacterium]
MSVKHIIWDWNGTLLDDCWLSVAAMNRLLEKYGLAPLTKERYREIFTFPVIDYYRELGFDFTREPFVITGTEFIDLYSSRAFEPRLHRNVTGILRTFQNLGITQSVLSASKQAYLEEQIKYHDLENFFLRVIGQEDHYAYGKTEAGKAWVKELHCGPHEVLFVGDTVHDFEVAREIGADCALVSNGHTSYRRLAATGAKVFRDVREISDWVVATLRVATD